MKAMITLIVSLSFIGLMTGCQLAQTSENDVEETNILNPDKQPNTTDPELQKKIGYVHYTADDINQDNENNHEIQVDREQMADVITRTILRSGHFLEVASLVTDKEIVIAYQPGSEIDGKVADDIASKTATSIIPKFYQIYTTDNPEHLDSIRQFQLSPTRDTNYAEDIENIINGISHNQ